MRQQHNIEPPVQGRGPNKKRKRDAEGDELDSDGDGVPGDGNDSSSESDGLPDYLAGEIEDGMVRGRPVWMAKYLITKAKYRWVLGEHGLLLTEYERLRREQLVLQEKKDTLLDQVLAASFTEPPTVLPNR
jgi:hypothetical protein